MTNDAVARATDPQTSWDAARSITNLNTKQARIYQILLTIGPATDEQVSHRYLTQYGYISPSGCRTRRSELCRRGLVEDSGGRSRLPSGRKSIEWQVVQ